MTPTRAGNGKRAAQQQPAIVKKYANRRLYNTATSSYITLDELCRMVRENEEFVVYDAKSGEDITRSVLTQIILEEDGKGRNLLPISFLRQVIGFYDDSLRAFLPRYLELSMENFAKNQDQIRTYIEETFGRFFPVTQFEDMARQNMALFQSAAQMFSPFGLTPIAKPSESQSAKSTDADGSGSRGAEKGVVSQNAQAEIERLHKKIEALEKQLNSVARR